MAVYDLNRISQLYTASQEAALESHSVDHDELHRLFQAVNELNIQLGETRQDDIWSRLMLELRRYRFRLSVAPLPPDYNPQVVADIEDLLNQAIDYYPDMRSQCKDVSVALQDLLDSSTSPMKDEVEAIINETDRNAIIGMVFYWSSLACQTQEYFANDDLFSSVSYLNPTALKKDDLYDVLIIFGTPGLYKDQVYIFTAPRALNLHTIYYRWFERNWKFPSLFEHDSRKVIKKSRMARIQPRQPLQPSPGMMKIDLEALLPVISATLRKEPGPEKDFDEHESSTVSARCFILEDGKMVFIDTEDQSELVIDLDSEQQRVRKVSVDEIEPDMFIVLRTEGGGDYLVDVADRMLGDQATELRETQREWKQVLIDLVAQNGLRQVVQSLNEIGSRIANYSNVRNWMWLSPRNIRTGRFEDFRAIFTLADRGKEAEKYWAAMGVIRGAHRRAGAYLRQLLISQIRASDLSDLERDGVMKFELEEDTGNLTAYRVLSIAPEEYTVEHTRLGIPLDME